MAHPMHGEFNTLASLIENLKDVARLQQLVETLATNQRDVTESLAEHRELYAERWASFHDLSRRLEVVERTESDLQARVERRATAMLDEVLKPAAKLLDRTSKIEQDLLKNGQVSEKLHAEFSRSVSEFQVKLEELHKRIVEKASVDVTAPVAVPGFARFQYGKVNIAVANYLIVLFLVLATVWSLSPIGRHVLNKYLPEGAPKVEAPKNETKNKGAPP